MKFYKAENKLPKKNGRYLCKLMSGSGSLYYSLMYFDHGTWMPSMVYVLSLPSDPVVYWASLPDIDKTESVHFSKDSDEWGTPQDFYDLLNFEYHFDLDPCASDDNHKCDKYFTIEDDGLKQDWSGHRVFVNPPYSKLKDWVKKCAEEAEKGTFICMLIPARTDTKAFHEYIYSNELADYELLKGRLKFGDSKNSAPFPSMLVFFNR